MNMRRKAALLNRRVGNRIVGGILPKLPGFGSLHHRGRRSGRQYSTPVKLFRKGGKYLISLPYGPDSDWVRNVIAAGGCEIRTMGRTVRLTEPRVFSDRELAALPPALRPILRWVGAYDFIELQIVDSPVLTRS
jgi:deazaflavin-dependent oxidoreductase (nitroreductase family)